MNLRERANARYGGYTLPENRSLASSPATVGVSSRITEAPVTRTPEETPFHKWAQVVRDVGGLAYDRLLASDNDPGAWDRVEYSENQGGMPPRRVDRLLTDAWVEGLQGTGVPLEVFGEEIDDALLDDVPDKTFVAVVDPLDGTGNWTNLGVGTAMTTIIYRKLRDELIYVGAHVVQVGWRRHWWAEPTATWRGSLGTSVEHDELVISPREARPLERSDVYIAGVGATNGRTRTFLDYLTRVEGFRTVTIGGAPLGAEVLDRELMALVECSPTTVFDSAHLMIAANTDAVVGLLDGTILSPTALEQMFLRVQSPKERVVEPYVLAKSAAAYNYIVAAYQNSTRV